jgi:O6-methylguanine-DNA--protein-cysteine methyltransferase
MLTQIQTTCPTLGRFVPAGADFEGDAPGCNAAAPDNGLRLRFRIASSVRKSSVTRIRFILSWGRAPDPALGRAQEQLEAYRDGELVKFDLPLAPTGTYYRREIYQRCSIPIARLASTGMLLST